MKKIKYDKIERILSIYTRLLEGKVIKKEEEAFNYGVNERSIQRDIDDIRNYFYNDIEEKGYINSVKYSREYKGFIIDRPLGDNLSSNEILIITKILLQSRSLIKEEMQSIIRKLLNICATKDSRQIISYLIKNENFHYTEPKHKKAFLEDLWKLANAIKYNNYIEIEYKKTGGNIVFRKLQPLSITFSEFYFYLIAFIDKSDEIRESFEIKDDIFPTIYRIDRIQKIKVLDEKFYIPYKLRFEEGEFLKRTQYMYGGKLQKVKFKYKGDNIEAILDKLPTAKILSEDKGECLVVAEVIGKGIDMYLRSQGDNVEIIDKKTV